MSSPFVGRTPELESIRAVQNHALADRSPGAVYITGEPGTGKSRLLAEIITQADAAHCVRLVGFEPTQPVPLAAVGELLRRLVTVPGHGAMLESLVFGGHRSPGSDPLRIFEAAHRALTAFGSLLLIVDDLQWVDERSVALLHYLLRAAVAAHHPLVVIVAARPAPGAMSFRSGLEAELPPERLATIELGPLPLEDGLSLVHAIDQGLDDAAATRLWRKAEGSPFWMVALAQAKGGADPGSIISERLRSLSNDASAMLAALAVGARPFLTADLGELYEWEPERVRHGARELVARGLALEASGGITVAHDLIREAASGTIPLTTRRTLHARLAEHIERSAGGDLRLLAEALDHRAAAALTTVDLATRIVASPQRRLLGAEDLLRLSSIADALPLGSAQQIELDEGLARLATELGERERAVRHWDRVAGAVQQPSLRQRAHLEAARVGYESGHPLDVHRHLAEARSHPIDAVTAIELDAIEAQVRLWDENDATGGTAAAARAVARGRELSATAGGADKLPAETRAALLAALVAASEAAAQEERPEELVELGAAALAIADSLGEEARLPALLQVAFAFHRLGRLHEAEERYREAWEISHRLMLPRSMVEAAIYLAQVLHALGRLVEAQAMAREADALQARIRPWLWGDMSKTVLHLVELSLGDTSAMERIRAGIAELDPHFSISVHQALAKWIVRHEGAGRAAEVQREMEAAGLASAAVGCPSCARRHRVVSADLLARVGRVDDARRELAEWEAEYRGPDYPARRLLRAQARASIAMASASPEAVGELADLADAFEAAGKMEEAAWALLDLGRLLSLNDRVKAIEALTSAAAQAERIGAMGLVRVAAQALRRLGVRAWRRGRAAGGDGLAALTSREQEVARLVAGGDSNREIGDALLVSPKTVERHITNVLAKLGLRNRTELAALVRSSSVRGSPDE